MWLSATGHRRGDVHVMWTFAERHYEWYPPIIEEWNQTHDGPPVEIELIGLDALKRRTMSGFMAGAPTAELIEFEIRMIGPILAGPVDAVGFTDLTDRLREENLFERINTPSFTPWMKDGRAFGVPHDVHPVMLAYRADIVEAAGIDVSQIETWDDFERVLGPLMVDEDGDGRADRHLISFWHTHTETLWVLLLQAGGGLFDETGTPILNHDANARVLARLAAWTTGPNQVAFDAMEFSAAGNQFFRTGKVLSALAPDWMCNVWKNDIPELSGKLKLMPVPAWEPGGRRTSVRGGTMIGIPKTAEDPEAAWAFIQHLYLDRDIAVKTYRVGDIITPVRAFWDDPVYDAPDPYFMNQRKGRDYIALADQIPLRSSSPFDGLALLRVRDALVALRRYAQANGIVDPAELEARASELLDEAQAEMKRKVDRNVFVGTHTREGDS